MFFARRLSCRSSIFLLVIALMMTAANLLTATVEVEGLPENAARVISLAPSVTQMIFALDADDLLVGRSMHCRYPPAALSIPSVGRMDAPDLEKILLLQPDCILLSDLTPVAVEKQLERLNLQTVRLQHSGLDGLRSDMEKLSLLLGRKQDGSHLLAHWDQTIAAIQVAVAKKSIRPARVLLLYSISDLFSAGKGSFIGDLIELCGGYNIAGKAISPWPQLNREAILAANPEVLFLALNQGNQSGAAKIELIQQLQTDAYWQQIQAVNQGRIHFIPSDWLSIPGPFTLKAIEVIFSAIHQP
jgi:iron complex transport system substrate-binding protein